MGRKNKRRQAKKRQDDDSSEHLSQESMPTGVVNSTTIGHEKEFSILVSAMQEVAVVVQEIKAQTEHNTKELALIKHQPLKAIENILPSSDDLPPPPPPLCQPAQHNFLPPEVKSSNHLAQNLMVPPPSQPSAGLPQQNCTCPPTYQQSSVPYMGHNANYLPKSQPPNTAPMYNQPGYAYNQNVPNMRNSVYVPDPAVKLYPLPTFTGQAEEWPMFYCSFVETTNEFGYNNKQNLIRLQKALQGSARQTVASLLIYPHDVPVAIEELKFNFGRPEQLVRSQLAQIQQMPAVNESNVEGMISYANYIRNIVALFKSANCSHQLMNPTLLEQLVVKLPRSKQFEWAKYISTISTFPTLEHLSIWASDMARVVNFMPVVSNIHQKVLNNQPTNQRHANESAKSAAKRVMQMTDQPSQPQKPSCENCQKQHLLKDCEAFKSLKVNDKWKFIKEHHLCISCLRKGHVVASCRSRKVCGIEGCTKPHNQTLHQPTMSQDQLLPSQPSAENEFPERIYNCRDDSNKGQLFKIVPVTLSGPLGSKFVFVMIDEGSSVSLLEESIADSIGLRGQQMSLSLQWYNDQIKTEKSRKVTVDISGQYQNAFKYTLKNIRTVKELSLPQQTFHKEDYEHLMSLPIRNYENVKPVMLLGLDNCFLGTTQQIIEAGEHQPVAAMTRLGWLAYGPVKSEGSTSHRICHVRQVNTLQSMSKLVEEYFSIENFGVRSTTVTLESAEDKRAREILQKSTRAIAGRYETALLWKEDDPVLPDSYQTALNRLNTTEKRMAKDDKYAKKYCAEIDKYISKGYARLLSDEEIQHKPSNTWYLPHFGVVSPNKPEKLRVVFDAAAKSSNVSLNSTLLKGPEHAQPLMAILFRFRQGVVAVAGDIEEMFSQVKININDQQSQRFLWRNGKTDSPVQIYVMSSMIFGAICSPCCAEYVKNVNAEKFKATMPRGAQAVIEKTYVDDLVISFDSVQEAEEVVSEAVHINAVAGFKLRNFTSNIIQIESKFNPSVSSPPALFNVERQSQTDKILGLFWNKTEDKFQFQFKFHKVPSCVLRNERPPTKREMLSIIMSIFDPFGLLANITIASKILLQHTWKIDLGWDEPLPPPIYAAWMTWWTKFQQVKNLSVPRCYSPLLSKAEKIDLHIFVDASLNAYAAVAYLRIKSGTNIDVVIVAAKSRVAPTKGLTVPKLELQAAVLGCRLKTLIEQSHEFKIQSTTFWSDSKTVILWIRSTKRQYKQFEAARISEILSVSHPDDWKWLPTDLNVADEATRPDTPTSTDGYNRWTQGPEFLRKDSKYWPAESPIAPHTDTIESCQQILSVIPPQNMLFDFERHSSYLKTLRVTAWVLRFINKSRRKSQSQHMELTAEELNVAEKVICQQVQREAYASEVESLKNGKRLSKSSVLFQLSPVYADDGLVRVRGRIDQAYCLPVFSRRPIILPPNHHVSKLIMHHFHVKNHHQNDNLTINEMRQRFWIPRAKQLLKAVKMACGKCVIARAQPDQPLMGQLPIDRLTPYVRPFSYCGVDYCGPFFVAIGRRREKRYICLFTCLTSRAVHLEVSTDLSTDSFLLSLRNFVNRRGVPIRMRSDNGTNFLGCQKELANNEEYFDFQHIQQIMSRNGIEWIFNCPLNPNAGGCWERLVQCVKRLLAKVLKEEAPRLEVFQSVAIEAENIINSRPLTDLPIKPEDEEPLTPNHFLVGCLNSTQTPSPAEENVCLRKQWRIAQNLKDRLWKRWTVEYLPQLLLRSKWHTEVPPLQLDQLVLILDSNQPRSQWQKGIITKVFTAKDGQVRLAEVRTATGTLRRPASKLAALRFETS